MADRDCLRKSNQPDMFAKVDAMRQQSVEREAARLEAARQQAAENRRRMPVVTRFVDAVRAVFPGAKVAFASEGGKTVGERSPAGVRMNETSIGSFSRRKP